MMLATPATRFSLIDASRGFAIVLMVIYHACYDLNYFHFVDWNLYESPFWVNFRTFIVTLFIGIAGISLSLACRQSVLSLTYLRRLGLLILCALLISAVSFALFHQRYIFFGILHFMVVASIIGLAFVHRAWLSLGVGIICLLMGLLIQHPVFNQPSLQWAGLMTHKPHTEDYVPFLPWFGVFLLGMFIGERGQNFLSIYNKLDYVGQPLLCWLGKRSLWIYLVHQPLLMGILFLVAQLKR
ncbi:DUF1624 domain-containing protein [Beggiatoa leptomitoformis]|uniref:DUF1624 domain-containing protein n=1 Tax=Beggiatoa leptomitoformis TaxID=288004 RepID=A0A2N9YDZ1_9GAMM|nr:heparan-alpha-glucosaminide N-acetyltransferase [Beggiatoa leptomitoformis]ALG68914.1 DUF1624 domain-containing protein [Beggiatoa leptomitoformis]AUI68708.1 DUF1624 domain-containing protein [Beggiatoa leptomitoformis]